MLDHSQRVDLANNARFIATGTWRQLYHIMAPCGWINDPNGIVYHNNAWHVFYQHHPFSPTPGPMYWGHAQSSDLIHWQHLPIAIAPGESYDQDGCWSGSALSINGGLLLMYTGNHSNSPQTQNIARSSDAIHFTKSPNNPVISTPSAGDGVDFRDPKMWLEPSEPNQLRVAIGARDQNTGKVLIYQSPDGESWQPVNTGTLLSVPELGHMCECPDFFPLGNKWVLISSIMSQSNQRAQFLVGDYDPTSGTFTYQSRAQCDFGPAYYAPQTCEAPGQRRMLFSWLHYWNAPNIESREGWCGCLSIPRELTLINGQVAQLPPAELQGLRTEGQHFTAPNGILPITGRALELRCTLSDGILHLRQDQSESAVSIAISGDQLTLTTRDETGVLNFDMPLSTPDRELIVYLDHSSVEIFACGGLNVMSARVYPAESWGEHIKVEGDCKALSVWKLGRGIDL